MQTHLVPFLCPPSQCPEHLASFSLILKRSILKNGRDGWEELLVTLREKKVFKPVFYFEHLGTEVGRASASAVAPGDTFPPQRSVSDALSYKVRDPY